MIEIKHINGSVLFRSETAATVREACEEACRSYANLRDANLRDADLRYANLNSANLNSANLNSANLNYADLRYADLNSANLNSATLRYADLRYANLNSANLRYANLRYANLNYADLNSANIRYANLNYADLNSASLHSAVGLNPYLVTPLMFLLDQPGMIRAYKLVNQLSEGPINGGLTYVVGESVDVDNASTDAFVQCGPGVNVATLDWCMREWAKDYRILIVEFTAADIAAIPVATDGKFRLHRCTVVGEVDLKNIGLVAK